MPVHVSWDDDDQTIIRLDFDGQWTWEEVFEATRQANTLSKQTSVPAARICDLRGSKGIPPNALPQLVGLAKLIPADMEMLVTVGANRTVHMVADLFFRLGGPHLRRERFHWAESIEQARFMIHVYRQRAEDASSGK